MIKKALVLGALVAGLLGALSAVLPAEAVPANQAAGITLSVQPADAQGFAGCQATVSVTADGTQDVAGLQFDLLFDPSVAKVVDDPATPRVDGITRGADLPGGHLMLGGADNTAGVATVVVVGSSGIGLSAVTIADITFDLVDAPGSSTSLTFAGAIAGDPSRTDIPVTSTGGTITIAAAEGFLIQGTVKLQLRTPATQGGVGFSSASVRAQGPMSRTVPVAPDGGFEVCGATDGTYSLTASAPGFLSAKLEDVVVAGENEPVPETVLLGGDADSTGFVSIDDITAAIASFAQTVQDCIDDEGRIVDIDCSGFVSIDDITGTIASFAKSSPQPWVP